MEVVIQIGSSLHFHREKFVILLSSSKSSNRVYKHFDPVEVLVKCLISINQYSFYIDVSCL